MNNLVKNSLFTTFLAISSLCLGTFSWGQAPKIAGNFVVVVKGIYINDLPNQGYLHFVKLATYSFRNDGTICQSFRIWNNKTDYNYGPIIGKIGKANQTNFPANQDETAGLTSVLNFNDTASPIPISKPNEMCGTWKAENGAFVVSWPVNPPRTKPDTENWLVTWIDQDRSLEKIELFRASYLSGSTFLSIDLVSKNYVRINNAINAGWGFGSANTPIEKGADLSECCIKDYRGMINRYNASAYYTIVNKDGSVNYRDEKTYLGSLDIKSGKFIKTNTGVLRYVNPKNPKDPESRNGFHYFGRPDASYGLPQNWVNYQVSNDFGDNGRIDDDYGHMYTGMQIIDTKGRVRGFVFADVSKEHSISAMYFLDDHSWSAHCGVNPNIQNKGAANCAPY